MSAGEEARTYAVYVLLEPRWDDPAFLLPRYIGHTNGIERRDYEHCTPKVRHWWALGETKQDYVEWERQLEKDGFHPIIGIIWDGMTKAEAIWLEKQCIIRALALGHILLNRKIPAGAVAARR